MSGSMRYTTQGQGRGDRTAIKHVADPYRLREKWPDPTLCPACGLIFRQGSWTDQPHEKPLNAEQHLCPACLRIRDGFPAAELRLSGVLFAKRSDEILQLIHNIEAKQRHDHPLERIMDIADLPDGTLIRFTGVHIAQRVAKAIKRAHRGCLESRYTDSETLMRISWQSE